MFRILARFTWQARLHSMSKDRMPKDGRDLSPMHVTLKAGVRLLGSWMSSSKAPMMVSVSFDPKVKASMTMKKTYRTKVHQNKAK